MTVEKIIELLEAQGIDAKTILNKKGDYMKMDEQIKSNKITINYAYVKQPVKVGDILTWVKPKPVILSEIKQKKVLV